MFLTLFGEKLNGTDPEDVIKNAFGCFDPDQKGTIKEDYLRGLLTTMGDRFTAEECDEMFNGAPVDDDGNFNEVTFFKVANKLLNFRSRRPQQQHQQPIAQPANSLHNQPPPPTKPSIDTTADNVPRRHHCCGVSCHGATLAKLTDFMRQSNLSSSKIGY